MAMKLARAATGRFKTVSMWDAFHGASLDAMSISGETMFRKDAGKWRFTSPTHSVRAFAQALRELEDEGGITKRYQRYCENQRVLVAGMQALGFKALLPPENQPPIITAFHSPLRKA